MKDFFYTAIQMSIKQQYQYFRVRVYVLVNLVSGQQERVLWLGWLLFVIFIYAHTCKIWISPAPEGTYLNILDMMKSPEKGDLLAD